MLSSCVVAASRMQEASDAIAKLWYVRSLSKTRDSKHQASALQAIPPRVPSTVFFVPRSEWRPNLLPKAEAAESAIPRMIMPEKAAEILPEFDGVSAEMHNHTGAAIPTSKEKWLTCKKKTALYICIKLKRWLRWGSNHSRKSETALSSCVLCIYLR